MANQKPRRRKCKNPGCEVMIAPRNSLEAVCGLSCAIEYAGTVEAKKRHKVLLRAENAKSKSEMRRKDLGWQHKQCQKVFNQLRRLQELKWFADRGLEPTCISCGKPKGGDQWCNGHFKTVGSQGGLRYDPMNSYLQHNVRCNQGLSGDIYGTKTTRGYIQGLKDRFGEESAKEIIDYCETHTHTVKWSCEELEAMRKEWNREIRQIRKQLE